MDQIYNLLDEKKQEGKHVQKKFLASIACLDKALSRKWYSLIFHFLKIFNTKQTQTQSWFWIWWGFMFLFVLLFLLIFWAVLSILIFLVSAPLSLFLTAWAIATMPFAFASIIRLWSWSGSSPVALTLLNLISTFFVWTALSREMSFYTTIVAPFTKLF